MSLAAWIPSSFRFFSICLLRASAARSSADMAQPILPQVAFTNATTKPLFFPSSARKPLLYSFRGHFTTTSHGSRLTSQESSFPRSPPPSSSTTSYASSPPPPPFDTYSPTASSSSSSLPFLSSSLATAPRRSPLPADQARHPGTSLTLSQALALQQSIFTIYICHITYSILPIICVII